MNKDMRYVDRDAVTGEVIGHYANEQHPKQESIPSDHADIKAFHAKRDKLRVSPKDPAAMLARIEALERLVAELEAAKGKS